MITATRGPEDSRLDASDDALVCTLRRRSASTFHRRPPCRTYRRKSSPRTCDCPRRPVLLATLTAWFPASLAQFLQTDGRGIVSGL